MDECFVAAVEAAFQAGLESRAAAAATVSSLNGSRRLAEQAALAAAWRFFVDANFEVTAVEIMTRVRAVCPAIAAERVREEFWLRLVERQAAGGCARSSRPVSG